LATTASNLFPAAWVSASVTDVTHTVDSGSVLNQIHYRWRNDDGSGARVLGAARDGSATIPASKNINADVIGSNRSTYADGIATTVTADQPGTF